jgi:flagellar protein FliS
MLKAAKAYFQTQVNTTSQGDLLLMLYDGAIKYLRQAKVKIEEKDYAEKGILISKAIDVVGELASSLNAEKGGDLAQNLNKLYFYCNTRLLQANLKMDTGLIDEVIRILEGLRSAFAQINGTAAAAGEAAPNVSAQARQASQQPAQPQQQPTQQPTQQQAPQPPQQAAPAQPEPQSQQAPQQPQPGPGAAYGANGANGKPAAPQAPPQQARANGVNGKSAAALYGNGAAAKPADQADAQGQENGDDAQDAQDTRNARQQAGANMYRKIASSI